jgi:diadenosine tetraphosphate (Ap4A) HIT family hydrolase
MFKDIAKYKFKKISCREDFYRIKKEYYKYGRENFKRETQEVFSKENAFSKMINQTSREKYSYLTIDEMKFILTEDKYSKNHYLLIPNNIKYTNILTFEKEDLDVLYGMKKIIHKYFSNNELCYFHCYPYNSIHTLHLHIVPKNNYIHKNNNLLLDDAIFVLNLPDKNIFKNSTCLDEWFKKHETSLLNIYIAACILIEQNLILKEKGKEKEKEIIKKELIPEALDYVLLYLVEKGIITFQDKENSIQDIENEKELLLAIEKILFFNIQRTLFIAKRNKDFRSPQNWNFKIFRFRRFEF